MTKEIVTQGWFEIMIIKYKQAIPYIWFLFSRYYVYIMLLIWSKSWNYVYWLLLFLTRIKFGHAEISVPKIGILMSKIVCIDSCHLYIWDAAGQEWQLLEHMPRVLTFDRFRKFWTNFFIGKWSFSINDQVIMREENFNTWTIIWKPHQW